LLLALKLRFQCIIASSYPEFALMMTDIYGFELSSSIGSLCFQLGIYNLLLFPNIPTTTVQSSTSLRRREPGGTFLSCAAVILLEAAARSNAASMTALAGCTSPLAAASAATRAAASLESSSQMPSVARMTTAEEVFSSCRLLVLGLAVM
jgi:hypothetical protein